MAHNLVVAFRVHHWILVHPNSEIDRRGARSFPGTFRRRWCSAFRRLAECASNVPTEARTPLLPSSGYAPQAWPVSLTTPRSNGI
jgi:hypothetical protein